MARKTIWEGTTGTLWTTGYSNLAADSNLLTGYNAGYLDLTSTGRQPLDVVTSFLVTTGGGASGGLVELWAGGSEDLTTFFTAGLTGTTGAVTVASAEKPLLRLIDIINTAAGGDRKSVV